MKQKTKFEALNFSIEVNGTPMKVVAKPYINASEEKRFRVSVDGSPIHIFGFNKSEQTFEMLDSPSEPIAPQVIRAIGEKLFHNLAA